jgi:hypothetical protein
LNENIFITSEILRIEWQSFPAQLTRKLKQSDEEEIFNYLYKLISNEARYIHEIKSSIFMSRTILKKLQFFNASIRGGNCNVLHMEHIFVTF